MTSQNINVEAILMTYGQDVLGFTGRFERAEQVPNERGSQLRIEWQFLDVSVWASINPNDSDQFSITMNYSPRAFSGQWPVMTDSIKKASGSTKPQPLSSLKGKYLTVAYTGGHDGNRRDPDNDGEWIPVPGGIELWECIAIGDTKDSVIDARPSGWEVDDTSNSVVEQAVVEEAEELDRDTVLLELAHGQTLDTFQQTAFADARTMKLDLVDSIVANAPALLQPLLDDGRLIQDDAGLYSRVTS